MHEERPCLATFILENFSRMGTLIIDNYDSFTYNLVHLLEPLTDQLTVWRNDKIDLEAVAGFDQIVLSPGPGLPAEAGQQPNLLAKYASEKPILGVCLGMQALVEHFGGTLRNLSRVAHGIATPIQISDSTDPLYAGLPASFEVGRYHSWVADETELPAIFQVSSQTDEGVVMSVKHSELPLWGVQYHPESIMTEHGTTLLKNWIKAVERG